MNKKEKIETIQAQIDEMKERLSVLENNENTDEYDEMIDDIYGEISVGCCKWDASQVLKEMDEIAYNMGFSEFNDEEISRLTQDIADLEDELKEVEDDE